MADSVRLLDQLRGLAEVGVRTGRVDEGADLAPADDRTGKDGPAGLDRGRQRLSCQRGLVNLDGVAVQQPRIRRHDVAKAQPDRVARHQFVRGRGNPLAVTLHPCFDREPGLQGGDRAACLALLPESDRGVGDEQEQDDEEVRPVPNDAGEDNRGLDHPRDRPPEIGQELQKRVDLLLFDLVRPVLGQPLLRFGPGEPVR
jgi:hypothetical protein